MQNMCSHCEQSEAIPETLRLLRFALYETLRERNYKKEILRSHKNSMNQKPSNLTKVNSLD
ncbi:MULTISPECIES: hypothetical protein [unclassified Nostoc]|uniref:hypothetical protein n=1 Tax=unclassified Nostoc TaxID=2593658 RepID=UPI000B95400A|nr:hypothetical protein [Nostoc sp. 'Peltigera membranacea cyanobiont' 232]